MSAVCFPRAYPSSYENAGSHGRSQKNDNHQDQSDSLQESVDEAVVGEEEMRWPESLQQRRPLMLISSMAEHGVVVP